MSGLRRIVGLVLMLVCVLCACTEGLEAAQQSVQTLTVVVWDYDKTSYDRHLVEAFEASHPEVQVNVISYPDTYYDQKAESLLLGDKPVDVFLTRTMAALKGLCDYEAVYPLDDLLNKYGLDLEDASILNAFRYNDRLYGIPYRQDRYVLFYNCDLFDRAGLPYPKERMTWEEVHRTSVQLQAAMQDDEYALMVLPMDIQWIASGSIWPINYREAESAEQLRPVMELLLEMQEEGTAPSYAECVAQDIAQQSFEMGKYGMYIGGSWYINYLTSDQKMGRSTLRWGATAAPYWPESNQSEEPQIFSGISISKNSENIALAWEFIQFVTGAQGAKIMAEEQMQPAYMDTEIAETYRNYFSGEYLDAALLERVPWNRGTLEQQDVLSQQAALSMGFRKCMVGDWTVDQAITWMRSQLDILQTER